MDQEQPLSTGAAALTQSEVERLLAQASAQGDLGRAENTEDKAKRVEPFDFRHSASLSPAELRKLRVEHEEYVRSLASRLSMYLRLEVAMQLVKVQTISYARFVALLDDPAHLTMFKAEPLRGVCIIDINPRLGLAMVDRLLGGAGQSISLNRALSEIEVALLDEVIQLIVSEWCQHWAGAGEFKPKVLGHETNGRFLQTAQPDTIMLLLAMETKVGDCMEQIQVAFPLPTLDPVIRKLDQALKTETELSAKAVPEPHWRPDFDSIEIHLSAECPRLSVKAREVLDLKVGHLLPLDPALLQQVELKLAGISKFVGRLGTQEKHLAVEITKILKS